MALETQRREAVGLLGTAFTMEEDFYQGRIAGHGVDGLVLDAGQRAECPGSFTAGARRGFPTTRLTAEAAVRLVLGDGA
ncbi:hypothetical protein ART_2434 [Arthrobacter sp. PAMC 25486]|nr:hypothetical protein ART_2434 [Arthrobacter sp. PAMC 25486]